MATTNHERVGKALDLLRQGLAPYMEREMRAACERQWRKQAAYSLKREGDLPGGRNWMPTRCWSSCRAFRRFGRDV